MARIAVVIIFIILSIFGSLFCVLEKGCADHRAGSAEVEAVFNFHAVNLPVRTLRVH
jgi:hypothetical protein